LAQKLFALFQRARSCDAGQGFVDLATRAEAHLGDGNRFVVRADELLTAFVELESAIRHAHSELA
jgi:hypothetical protein